MLALLLILAWHFAASAVPQIDWTEQINAASRPGQRSAVSVDLRKVWEITRVAGAFGSNAEFSDPNQVWNWSPKQFSTRVEKSFYALKQGERLVARIQLLSEKSGTELNLSMQMPRLDAAHVSYRYNSGPWTTLSAGDTLAMSNWSLPERQPTFNIPLMVGQTDIVVEMAHRGSAYSPILAQNDAAYLGDLTLVTWVMGILVGITLLLALMGLLTTLNFQRTSFLGVCLMNCAVSVVLFFNSGLGGQYFGAHSAWFNDEVKFFSNNLWCLCLPWVAAVSMGIHQGARRWWQFALATLIGGVALSLIYMDYSYRDAAVKSVPLVLATMVLITIVMAGQAWARSICRSRETMAGIGVYVVSFVPPFLGFLGFLGVNVAALIAAVLSMLAGLLIMRGIYLQHRMGRQVLARANTSPWRDVLTGLLNRDGLQAHLYDKVRSRVQKENTSAIFIYVSVTDAEQAMHEHGEQGFEMGMVQIAASLSTSISGFDGLARMSSHAFGVTVLMPPDPAAAIRVAQKILARLMTLSSHGTVLAGSARISMAWLPLYGFRVDALERRCLRALQEMEAGKRIGWVGGAQSHTEAAQLMRESTLSLALDAKATLLLDDLANERQDGATSNIFERIHRIEREMLHGVPTQFLVAEAERMSQELNDAHSSQGGTRAQHQSQTTVQDFARTELIAPQQKQPS
jgi:GGDEF domain-containing protein